MENHEFIDMSKIDKRIGGIQYCVMTKNDILDQSVLALTNKQFYNDEKFPQSKGPLDLRMGPSMQEHTCKTCGNDFKSCYGHFGYIRLALPIFHLGFFPDIVNILQCICKRCGRILLEEDQTSKYRSEMLKAMKASNYVKRSLIYKNFRADCKKIGNNCCKICGFVNGKLTKLLKMPTTIFWQNKKLIEEQMRNMQEDEIQEKKSGKIEELIQFFNPLMTLEVFQKIRKKDICLFNINSDLVHPSDLIITHILAPPCCIRPTVKEADSNRHDDLTVKLRDFLQRNELITNYIQQDGESIQKINAEWFMLQCSYSHYLNAECKNLPVKEMTKNKKDKFDIRALAQRLKGKQGRFRQNLSGKRSNFTARTVISPDPNLPIDTVVVPLTQAKILTFPEVVTNYNIKKLKLLVSNGTNIYPGAMYLFKKNGDKFFLNVEKRTDYANQLEIGDVVERHLENGDIILFNRQPSLHRISIMAFEANIQKWNTLRFNECCCAPFNADFDGDEMNIHVPQTLEARAEAKFLLNVKENLISPKNGEIIISLTQDFLTASYLITHKDIYLNREQFSQVCCFFTNANQQVDLPLPAIVYPIELWTGKQVISTMIRPNKNDKVVLNVQLTEKCYDSKANRGPLCPKDGFVIFDDSELLSGMIGKACLGGGNKNGIFYRLIRDNSTSLSAMIMARFAKLSGRWISDYGMSMGISDVTPYDSLFQENEHKKNIAIIQCEDDAKKYQEEKLKQQWDMAMARDKKAMVEATISTYLNQVRDDVGTNCLKELPPTNGPLIMATCGSKGSSTNISQMIGCVGQQMISGKRAPDGFTSRTLPHFPSGKEFPHPEAMGFVRNSFFSGLTPPEFFFHTMAGRESLVDTAIKTAGTGYMSRRLVHLLEDVTVCYDGTIRACDSKDIIQFKYGGDGVCPWMSEEKVGDNFSCPIDLNALHKYVQSIKPYKDQGMNPYQISEYVSKQLKYENYFEKFVPIDIQVTEEEIQQILIDSKTQKQELLVKDALDNFKVFLMKYFQDICKKIIQTRQNMGLDPGISRNCIQLDKSQQRKVDNQFNITQEQIELFFITLWERYPKILVEPGEAVGPVAATSISEPATQMTLKSFHFAGVASMNITQGVPRMEEIINASKHIKAPVIEVKLWSQYQNLEKIYRNVKLKIEKTYLDEISQFYKEIYTPHDCYLLIQLDNGKMKDLLEFDICFREDIIEGILSLPKINIKPEQISFIEKKNKKNEIVRQIKISLPMKETNLKQKNIFFIIQNWKKMVPSAIIYGMPKVKRVTMSKDMEKNQKKYKFELFVEGNVFKQILQLDEVDCTQTCTVDIHETFQVLGIEAARKQVINEITKTIKSHSLNVDKRHLIILSDILTSKGRLYGSTRTDIAYLKDSTLMLASFEKTTENLYNAALQGRYDNLEGVSERIIVGQNIQMGTGIFDLYSDDEVKQKNKDERDEKNQSQKKKKKI